MALEEGNKKTLEQGFFSEWISEGVGLQDLYRAALCTCSHGSSPGTRWKVKNASVDLRLQGTGMEGLF